MLEVGIHGVRRSEQRFVAGVSFDEAYIYCSPTLEARLCARYCRCRLGTYLRPQETLKGKRHMVDVLVTVQCFGTTTEGYCF